ncbi:hypothetical protein MHBO_005291 [Bonamia ostreae]|uniref:NADH dehydrogenase subunit 4L n=1 Tax=Bonamia ostreae TaxID=126728 RepID=A0ABV2AIP7_9EUKA
MSRFLIFVTVFSNKSGKFESISLSSSFKILSLVVFSFVFESLSIIFIILIISLLLYFLYCL